MFFLSRIKNVHGGSEMKKWKFIRFITLLLFSASLALSCFICTSVSAASTCVSGQTYPSNGLKLYKYGGAEQDVTTTWWSSYTDATSPHIQKLRFSFAGMNQPGYYTVTWSEVVRNPESGFSAITSIAGSDSTTVLNVDVASAETDGNLYYSYFATVYKNSSDSYLYFSQDVNITSPTLWSITSPLASLYVCNDGGSDYSSALSSIASSIDTNNVLATNIKDLLLFVSDTRLPSIQTAIENINYSSQATTDAVNNQTTVLNNSINSLQQETETGNQQAQDRWEQDKEEEADREEQGSDDMSSLTSIFRFEIRNPFMGLLGLFTNNCPVNIPVVAGMLGSSQTVYPCWFSQQTRGILTPVIGISSSMLLFGYLVRKFLNGSTFNDTMEF